MHVYIRAAAKKYCDLTGLEAHYTDPKTRLRYHSVNEYLQVVRIMYVYMYECSVCMYINLKTRLRYDSVNGFLQVNMYYIHACNVGTRATLIPKMKIRYYLSDVFCL